MGDRTGLQFSKTGHGEAHFIRAVHLGFDDVHRSRPRVFQRAFAAQIMQCTKGGEKAVHEAFGNLVALGIQNRGVGHEVSDVAHKQEAPPRQADAVAVGRR